MDINDFGTLEKSTETTETETLRMEYVCLRSSMATGYSIAQPNFARRLISKGTPFCYGNLLDGLQIAHREHINSI